MSIGQKINEVVNVDDLIFLFTDTQNILDLAGLFRSECALFEEEADSTGLLGVKLTRLEDGRNFTMKCGLIEHIITEIGVDTERVKMKSTPADRKPFVKDAKGAPCE